MLFGDLAKRTKSTKPTLDRYIRLGLIPYEQNQNGYRVFKEEEVERVEMIRTLKKRPFKRNLEEIKKIFDKVPLPTLVAKKKASNRELLQHLDDDNLL